jgi:hypothetical protein
MFINIDIIHIPRHIIINGLRDLRYEHLFCDKSDEVIEL